MTISLTQHDSTVRSMTGSIVKERKIAFVVQRCGREVNGGAEAHCLAIAQRMSAHWQTEVLTTCAVDYVTWDNFYAPGPEQLESTVVRRFPVAAPRITEAFNRLSEELHSKGTTATQDAEEAWMQAQGPCCPELVSYIEANADEYDAFIFFTYLYWHTWEALPKVAARAILVPLAHDEWTIYLSLFSRLFAQVNHFIFNTVEERQLLQRLSPGRRVDGPVVGVAVDRPATTDPLRFRRDYKLNDEFLLYVGRIDRSKGCDEMFQYFVRGREQGQLPSKLVLLGRPVMSIPDHPDIVSLGFVAESVKWDALSACSALVMPSVNESLSMVLLEAWTVGKPVIVNGRCEVLVGQCRRSNGGLWYSRYEEWLRVLERLRHGRTASVLGRQGWRFVHEHYSWPAIEQAYLETVESVIAGAGNAVTRMAVPYGDNGSDTRAPAVQNVSAEKAADARPAQPNRFLFG
jgi:glycosyltransferase involved in cell wall biosynthesis